MVVSYIHVAHILPNLRLSSSVDHLQSGSYSTHQQVSFSLLHIRYFRPLWGYIPKLDQVLHSQLVTHVLWCYHRMSCAGREVLFLDQRYGSWLEWMCWMDTIVQESECGSGAGSKNPYYLFIFTLYMPEYQTVLPTLSMIFFEVPLWYNTLNISDTKEVSGWFFFWGGGLCWEYLSSV